jgi:hypothetical protein
MLQEWSSPSMSHVGVIGVFASFWGQQWRHLGLFSLMQDIFVELHLRLVLAQDCIAHKGERFFLLSCPA